MTEPLLIGARGWEFPPEEGGYYPPELPEEWRFCFYSNRLRSVLVPADTWNTLERGQVQQWREDCDAQFRFVPEAPAGLTRPAAADLCAAQLSGFLSLIEPIRPRVAGMLLRVAADASPDADWLARVLALIGADMPVCVDLAPAWRTPEMLATVSQAGAGLCWHAQRDPAPLPGGRFLVALSPAGNPRMLRGLIETLAAWRQGGAVACLFLEGAQGGKAADEARIIAELLEV